MPRLTIELTDVDREALEVVRRARGCRSLAEAASLLIQGAASAPLADLPPGPALRDPRAALEAWLLVRPLALERLKL